MPWPPRPWHKLYIKSKVQQHPSLNSIACITLSVQHSLALRTLYLIGEGGGRERGGGALLHTGLNWRLKTHGNHLLLRGAYRIEEQHETVSMNLESSINCLLPIVTNQAIYEGSKSFLMRCDVMSHYYCLGKKFEIRRSIFSLFQFYFCQSLIG